MNPKNKSLHQVTDKEKGRPRKKRSQLAKVLLQSIKAEDGSDYDLLRCHVLVYPTKEMEESWGHQTFLPVGPVPPPSASQSIHQQLSLIRRPDWIRRLLQLLPER